MALASLDDLAAFVRRDLDDADAYTAELMLDGASALVVEYCGWHIAPSVSETLVVDGSNATIQALPTMHLTDVVSVRENGDLLDVSALDWSTYGLLEKRGGMTWTSRRRAVEVELTHGLDVAPKWLQTLVCAVAGRALSTPLGIAQEGAGGEQVSYATPYLSPPGEVVLLDMEKAMLDRIAVPGTA